MFTDNNYWSSGFIFLPANIMFWWSYNLINFILTVSKSLYFAGISHALSSVYTDVTTALVCCNFPVLTVKIASDFNMKFMEISAFEQLSKQLLILQPEHSCIYIYLCGEKKIFSSLSSYFPPSTVFPSALLYFLLPSITSSGYLLALCFNNTALASTKVLFNVGDVLQP